MSTEPVATKAESAALPSRRGRLRKRAALALRIAVSVALVVVLVHQAGLGNISRTVARAQPGWLAAGFAVGVAAAGLQANQWSGLLAALGLGRGYLRTLRLDTAARAFDAALPTSIGGDVARATLVSTSATDRIPAALSVVLRRLMQLPGLVTVLIAGLALSWSLPYAGRVRPFALAAAIAGVTVMVLVTALGKVTALRRLPTPRALRRLAAEWALARRRATEERPFLRAALRGLYFWCTVVLSQWLFMKAVGIHAVPLGYATVVVATVNALSMLPISLGGYGLREGAFSAFLTAGGLATAAQGAAVGACLSIQTLLFGLVGGLVYLTLPLRTRAALNRETATQGDPSLCAS